MVEDTHRINIYNAYQNKLKKPKIDNIKVILGSTEIQLSQTFTHGNSKKAKVLSSDKD